LIFFIISSVRSGSTAITQICNTASNCWCGMETHQNAKSVIWHLKNNPSYSPEEWIRGNIGAERQKTKKPIYGQKDPVFGPLIPYLHEAFDCKFVYLIRDGREVVTSMLNWNQNTTGYLYRECREPVELSEAALEFSRKIEKAPFIYLSDLVRPRPEPDEPIAEVWRYLSRLEMYAWYWKRSNEIIQENLAKIPAKKAFWINLSNGTSVDQVNDMIKWIGLENVGNVRPMLESRINSSEERGFGKGTYPHWSEWSDSDKDKFDRIAGDMMKRLEINNA